VRLINKVAIITGGSRGIGRGVAVAFAGEGATVVIVGRNKGTCDETAAFITKSGGTAIGIAADVSKEADVAGMVSQTMDKFNRVDLLVNSAAVNLPYREVGDVTLDDWNWLIGVNLTGIFLCCKAVLPQMKKQGNGQIVNVISVAGMTPSATSGVYNATKYAVQGFTESLKLELAATNIRVMGFYPGGMEANLFTTQALADEAGPFMVQKQAVAEIITFMLKQPEGITVDHVEVKKFP